MTRTLQFPFERVNAILPPFSPLSSKTTRTTTLVATIVKEEQREREREREHNAWLVCVNNVPTERDTGRRDEAKKEGSS
jgi:hypothetical protein